MALDPVCASLKSRCASNPSNFPYYKVIDDLLFHKERIWVNSKSRFCSLLLQEYPGSLLGGHAGIKKTLTCLTKNFYWEGVSQSVYDFVSQCFVCQ